jgi:hypothetical protein
MTLVSCWARDRQGVSGNWGAEEHWQAVKCTAWFDSLYKQLLVLASLGQQDLRSCQIGYKRCTGQPKHKLGRIEGLCTHVYAAPCALVLFLCGCRSLTGLRPMLHAACAESSVQCNMQTVRRRAAHDE